MGLLDDSIREHLELKRRRGADAAEVARQEQEAFGPPRRGDFEVAPAEAHAAEGHTAQAVLDDPTAFADEAPTALHAVDDVLPVQDEPPRPHGDPAAELPAAEPEPVHEEPVAPVPEPASQETQAFDPDEVRAATAAPDVAPPPPSAPVDEPEDEPEPAAPPAPRADEAPEGDEDADVLEETPEFLQETPEHDRLWFEQRPPRDFDF